jgi:hypothetical protein
MRTEQNSSITQNRFIGLGASPDQCGSCNDNSIDALKSVTSCAFTQVPVIEYTTRTIQLPLHDSAIDTSFGQQIDLLNIANPGPNGVTVESSFVGNGNTLQADMLAMGIGIHGFGEPLQFSLIGNAMTPLPAPGSPIFSPDVFTANDLANNALGVTTGVTPAELEWGGADWNAMWHMMEGYEFVWTMNQRYNIIQEIAADVAYFGPYAEASAASDSEVVAQQYVRQVNNRYRDLAAGGIFVPVQGRRMGSVSIAGPLNLGVFHPSRDFDTVGATWGGIRNQGGAACCQPFRKFSKPVLFERGIPIGMKLQAKDSYHVAQMQRYMSLSERQGGNLATVSIDANVTGLTAAGANTANELTLDQGPNVLAAQRVNTDRVIFKGGVMKLAVLIKGVEVWGAWKQYLVGQAGLGRISAPTAVSGAPAGITNLLPGG